MVSKLTAILCIALLTVICAVSSVAASNNDYYRSVGISGMLADKGDEFQPESTKLPDTKEFKKDNAKSPTGRKSVVKAALLSALLPGAGEYYIGNRAKARYFLTVEAISWAGCIAFRTYGHWKKEDYERYAKTYANANLEGKSEEFRDMVGFYRSIDDYNSLGRVYDPERPYLYDTPENHWRWQSDADQAAYRNLKNRSREAYRRGKFMIGIAVANRIISIIDAIRDTRRANRSLDHSFSLERPLQIQFSTFDDGAQLQLALKTPF